MQMILSAIANPQVNLLRSSRAVAEGARTARDLATRMAGAAPAVVAAPLQGLDRDHCDLAPFGG
jgi:hypothetical protein